MTATRRRIQGQTRIPVGLRLTPETNDRLVDITKKNGRSMSSEMESRIDRTLREDDDPFVFPEGQRGTARRLLGAFNIGGAAAVTRLLLDDLDKPDPAARDLCRRQIIEMASALRFNVMTGGLTDAALDGEFIKWLADKAAALAAIHAERTKVAK